MGGGEKESERLDVPLLAKIPISKELMDSTDSGTPITLIKPDSSVSSIFSEVANKVVSHLQG
jgi:ATP-binding protein involved in chromosome partitioning